MVWLLVVIVLTGVTSNDKGHVATRPIGRFDTERECNEAMAKAYLRRDFYQGLPAGAGAIGMKCWFVSEDGLS
jgi:hypothetical protein